jgi:hypothetical protein
VLARPLRLASVLASAIVVLSFALFAIDETSAASQRTTAEIAGQKASAVPDPDPRQERARERAHSSVRELVDDADDALLAPFAWAAPDDGGTWSRRAVPALLALLVYGLALPFLARYLQSVG